eukprot:2939825-Alexandrium_andersonii.AAC.1
MGLSCALGLYSGSIKLAAVGARTVASERGPDITARGRVLSTPPGAGASLSVCLRAQWPFRGGSDTPRKHSSWSCLGLAAT